MARRDTPVFYPGFQGLVSKLLDRPWQASDGMPPAELQHQVQQSVAAQQLQELGNELTADRLIPPVTARILFGLGNLGNDGNESFLLRSRRTRDS